MPSACVTDESTKKFLHSGANGKKHIEREEDHKNIIFTKLENKKPGKMQRSVKEQAKAKTKTRRLKCHGHQRRNVEMVLRIKTEKKTEDNKTEKI